ncbi:TetR/AcrR family transcriptional regulator [Xylanimonas allomyrinae]|uniref:TetR/AcrR family transcriptional regulator n=1 Tax=Xylanimonas allomyrinae TaxID=2509459 RepID=UPI001FE6A448|nr:TetR family transcriptional regulator C-terminal domain-containing protein [Xylanimonas allomyrinae]
MSAVSVRTVAANAGMAVGSLRHLFPTQAALLEFSAELMVERATARVVAITPHDDDAVAYAFAVISELLPLAPHTRREFELNVALIAETPAHPGLARIRDHTHQELLRVFTRLAARLRGEPEPTPASAKEGQRLLALVDGLGLHLIHRPAGEDTTWAADLVREELARLAVHG